jgi:hypothetical protein
MKKELKKKPGPPGFVRQEIGSGITKRTRTRFSGPLNIEGVELLKDTLSRASVSPLVVLEDTLRDVLREAGLPDDPTEGGKHPHRSHVTPELSDSAYHSGAWYAAAVLDELAFVRWLYEVAADRDKKAVYDAAVAGFRAGNLHREGRMKFQWEEAALFGDKALRRLRGPRSSRRHPVLMDYLKGRLRRNRNLTAVELWNELKQYDDAAPLKVKGGEIVFEDGILKIYSPHGNRSFTRKKFREYFSACKNPPTPAE